MEVVINALKLTVDNLNWEFIELRPDIVKELDREIWQKIDEGSRYGKTELFHVHVRLCWHYLLKQYILENSITYVKRTGTEIFIVHL
jgi:hypothetical protein